MVPGSEYRMEKWKAHCSDYQMETLMAVSWVVTKAGTKVESLEIPTVAMKAVKMG